MCDRNRRGDSRIARRTHHRQAPHQAPLFKGDGCERRRWRIQRATRSGSGQNSVSECEQRILGTATGPRRGGGREKLPLSHWLKSPMTAPLTRGAQTVKKTIGFDRLKASLMQKAGTLLFGLLLPYYNSVSQISSLRLRGILMQRGPPRPRESSPLGMRRTITPSSSRMRLVT